MEDEFTKEDFRADMQEWRESLGANVLIAAETRPIVLELQMVQTLLEKQLATLRCVSVCCVVLVLPTILAALLWVAAVLN